MSFKIAFIQGDGIGREIIAEGIRVIQTINLHLQANEKFVIDEFDWGEDYYMANGKLMPDDWLETLKRYDAIVLGPMGGGYGNPPLPDYVPLDYLLKMRQGFDQYVNSRPAKLLPGAVSPLAAVKSDKDLDMLIIRENAEGEYSKVAGNIKIDTPEETCIQTAIHSHHGIERIIRYGFEEAKKRRKHVTLASKSNALQCMRLWDKIFYRVAKEYPDIKTDVIFVDALSMNMVLRPQAYDVIVASNLFGDILSDLAGALCGSIGALPSANLDPTHRFPSMFQGIHGSAPDIAGKDIANPLATILSLNMMFEFLSVHHLSDAVNEAVRVLVTSKKVTCDMGGSLKCSEFGKLLCEHIDTHLPASVELKKNVSVAASLVAELEAVLGKDYIKFDDAALVKYGTDKTEDFCYKPEIVVIPADTKQVSEIVKLANKYLVPITPRAAGTGMSGGALPIKGGILMSMERFNKILDIDEMNMQVTCEPGVVTQALMDAVEAKGLYYPVDPASKENCHMGGNIAHSAGGPHAVKYQTVKDYVLALEVVTPTGEIINTGGRVLKNSTGYHLTQLMVGSEGTLGIVTKMTLKLLVKPKLRRAVLVAFPSLKHATSAVAEIFRAGIVPAAIEFLDYNAVKVAESYLKSTFPNSEAPAHLIVECDGNNEDIVVADIEHVIAVVKKLECTDVQRADTEADVKKYWKFRKNVLDATKAASVYSETDAVVPRASLPQLVAGVKAACAPYNIRSVCYGHCGDGNVHCKLLKDDKPYDQWRKELQEDVVPRIVELIVSLGGCLSGEHGIGITMKRYLAKQMCTAEIDVMRQIKKAMDPNNIMNPGKIFDM